MNAGASLEAINSSAFKRFRLALRRKIGTGCDAIFPNGPRNAPRRIPGGDHGDARVRLNARMLEACFANLAIAILDGARPTLYGKPFVAAPGVNTNGVNRSAP